MDFVKRNLFILISLGVGLASVGLGMMACNRFEATQTSMAQAADFGRQLDSAKKARGRPKPFAPVDIHVQEQNLETVEKAVNGVHRKAKVINETGLEPLVADFFPDQMGRQNKVLAFVIAYRKAKDALPGLLRAGSLPTQADIDAVKAALGGEGAKTTLERAVVPSARRRPGPSAKRKSQGSLSGLQLSALRGAAGRDRTRRKVGGDKDADAKKPAGEDPARVAQIKRAQSIHCYVGDTVEETFTVIPGACDVPEVANPLVMWQAQLTLWIQQEVCLALADVNNAAAKKIKASQETAPIDVTTLPVKRIIRLSVGNYRSKGPARQAAETEKGGRKGKTQKTKGKRRSKASPKGEKGGALQGGALGKLMSAGRNQPKTTKREESGAPGEAVSLGLSLTGPVWTGREGDQHLDVVPVGMRLIIDERYLLQVIDRICRMNFYVFTQVSYRRLEREELEGSYVYGPSPLIEVSLTFDRYFYTNVEAYQRLMPPSVHEALGHAMALEGQEEGQAEGKTGRKGRKRRSKSS